MPAHHVSGALDIVGGHKIVGRQSEEPVRKNGRMREGPLKSNELWDPGNPCEVGIVKARSAQMVAIETVHEDVASDPVGCKQGKPQRFTLRR